MGTGTAARTSPMTGQSIDVNELSRQQSLTDFLIFSIKIF